MVLLRALLGGVEVSLLAAEVRPDALLPSHVRIERVEGVSDPAFPALRFLDLVLPRAAVLWYALVEPVEEALPEPALAVERRIGSKAGEADRHSLSGPPDDEPPEAPSGSDRATVARYRRRG